MIMESPGRWKPEIFDRTYTHLGGNRWRRTGSVKARPAVEGELIDSLEGRQTAHAGDWVIKGAKGEQWVTSGDHFAANYERAGDPGSYIRYLCSSRVLII